MIQYLKVKSLPPELWSWREKIEKYAQGEGLDFFETIFEVLSYDKMNEIAATFFYLLKKNPIASAVSTLKVGIIDYRNRLVALLVGRQRQNRTINLGLGQVPVIKFGVG